MPNGSAKKFAGGGLPRLLFLDAAEQEIEQALGGNAAGRKHKRARKGRGGHKRRAAPHARKANSVRNANSTQRNKRAEALQASVRVTLTGDGK